MIISRELLYYKICLKFDSINSIIYRPFFINWKISQWNFFVCFILIYLSMCRQITRVTMHRVKEVNVYEPICIQKITSLAEKH